jgi:hypothetical protein
MPSIYQPGLTKLEISPALEGSAGWRRIDRREAEARHVAVPIVGRYA